MGKGRQLHYGDDVAVLSLGPIGTEVEKAIDLLQQEGASVKVAHYDMRFLKPIDEDILHEVGRKFKRVITVEDGVVSGGLGSAVLEFFADHDYQVDVERVGIPDAFVEHGTVAQLRAICKMDAEAILNIIKQPHPLAPPRE